ncbi:MAG: tRNA pseudouridine(38-40) synthase TruA [Chitinophagaceae bacterium]|nr:tRNA pseudouridine(38-40) synthase TruA [Chitinophagaceae bacterium]
MHRYFIEVAYKGAGFAGFQIQDNAVTIQSEIQRAMQIVFKREIPLTGSSRTDTGVNALQNYFHFDSEALMADRYLYNLNAILPPDIVIKKMFPVPPGAHCRFDAVGREYVYYVYKEKNPFLYRQAYYYPYTLDFELLQQAAAVILHYTDFTAFSKRNTQVKNFNCGIVKSSWSSTEDSLVYEVQANRFLRGMVRGLTGTMLQVGRGKMTVGDFQQIVAGKDPSKTNFAVPGYGLFLKKVHYPTGYFDR